MEQNDQPFSYTYSSGQQEEVQRIRKKYLPSEPDKMEQLRKLDQSVTKRGMILSLAVGILSTLVLGVGMCCTMVWTSLFIPGIFIGVLGIIGMGAAYPVYSAMVKRQRKKIAPQILRLSQELINNR